MSATDRVRVDSRGTRCPRPVIDAARAARIADPGTVLELLADDPAADADVPAWCRMRGHTLLTTETVPPEAGGGRRYEIRLG